jgi:hypothetical protein
MKGVLFMERDKMKRILFIGILALTAVLMSVTNSNARGLGGSLTFSDPDLQILGVPSHPTLPAFVIIDLNAADTDFKCCPPGAGGDNSGCQDHINQRFETANISFVALDNNKCKNNYCQFKIRDILIVNDFADDVEAQVCSPHIIRTVTDSRGQQCRELFFTRMTFTLKAYSGATNPANCSSTTPCNEYWEGTADFFPLFTSFGDLCMHDGFKTTPVATCTDEVLGNDSLPDCNGTLPLP